MIYLYIHDSFCNIYLITGHDKIIIIESYLTSLCARVPFSSNLDTLMIKPRIKSFFLKTTKHYTVGQKDGGRETIQIQDAGEKEYQSISHRILLYYIHIDFRQNAHQSLESKYVGPHWFFFQVILVLHYNIQQSAVNYTYHFKHNSDHNNFLGYLSFLCGTSLSRQLIQTHFFQFQFQLLIKFLTNRVFLSIPNTFLLDFDQSYKT